MAKKKLTVLQQAYQKQIKRLKNAVRRAEKEGYLFKTIDIPEMPKRVTKQALEKIKKIKPKELKAKAEFVIFETGEIIPATEHIQEVKQKARQKVQETRQRKKQKPYYPIMSPIDSLREQIDEKNLPSTAEIIHQLQYKISTIDDSKYSLPITQRQSALISIIENAISIFGSEEEYAQYIIDNQEAIYELIDKIENFYEGKQGQDSFAELGELLQGEALSPSQAESLSYMSEIMNGWGSD